MSTGTRCPHGVRLGSVCPSKICGDGSGAFVVTEGDVVRSRVRVTIEDGSGTRTVLLPEGDYVAVACRWSEAREAIAGHLANANGTMRLWKATELADQAVEALAALPVSWEDG